MVYIYIVNMCVYVAFESMIFPGYTFQSPLFRHFCCFDPLPQAWALRSLRHRWAMGHLRDWGIWLEQIVFGRHWRTCILQSYIYIYYITSSIYIYNMIMIMIYKMWGPPVKSWFVNTINYSYKYHKP